MANIIQNVEYWFEDYIFQVGDDCLKWLCTALSFASLIGSTKIAFFVSHKRHRENYVHPMIGLEINLCTWKNLFDSMDWL